MSSTAPEISVILSTYNSEAWLEKVLWGYQVQIFKNFEVVIADDGSGPATRQLIEQMQALVDYPVRHIWHEDEGFRKTKILNKALLACKAPYVVMSDGDCIPRADFLLMHLKYRKPGYFLSGGYFKLPMITSIAITKEVILHQHCFSLRWLWKNGLTVSAKSNKLIPGEKAATVCNRLTPTKPSWNGHNASGWLQDILAVGGFDERMKYGAEDREMGDRLIHAGVKPRQIRYAAICVHLDHSRGYVCPVALAENETIWQETLMYRKTCTSFGIPLPKPTPVESF